MTSANDLNLVLRRRHIAALAAAYFLFIVYGCLIPFHYRPMPFDKAVDAYRHVAQHFYSPPAKGNLVAHVTRPVGFTAELKAAVGSRSDFLANVLLYIPYGFLLMALLCVDRHWLGSFLCAPAVIAAGVVTSMTIEFLQLYFPPRTCSFSDVLSNSIGGTVGALVWVGCGQRLLHWCRLVWTSQIGVGLAGLLLPGYLFLVFVLSQLPPNLSISPVELYHKYEEGMVRLIPFKPLPKVDPYEQAEEHLFNAAYFLPVGLLLAFLPAPFWRARQSWRWVFGIGLLTTSTIEFLQLFNLERFFDASDIVSGTLAILAGWRLGLEMAMRQSAVPLPDKTDMAKAALTSHRRRVDWLIVFGLLWLGAVLFVEWHPFRFGTTPRWPGSWMPFEDYASQHTYFQPLDQLVRKTLLFLPGGVLLTLSLAAGYRYQGWRVVCLAFIVASTAEVGQLFVETRYFSITDILVETNGGWLGFLLASHARAMTPGKSLIDIM